MLSREEAKKMAQSRNCKCVNEKNRDNNYNKTIDLIYDEFEKKLNKKQSFDIHNCINDIIIPLNNNIFFMLMSNTGTSFRFRIKQAIDKMLTT